MVTTRSTPINTRAVFIVCGIGAFITALDLSITNVAFAEIQRAFPDVSRAGISWVVTAYNIMFGSLLIAGGRIADRVGRKRVFQLGVLIFGIGSALCGVAPDLAVLVGGRAIQGIGGALLMPATLGLLLGAFPAEKRTQVVTMWGGIGALGVASGPTLGALLIDAAGWRAAFWINVPICLGSMIVGARVLTESPRQTGPRPDYPGAVMITVVLAAIVVVISEGQSWGWTDPVIIGSFLVAVALTPVFVLRSRRHPEPMVDLTLFESRSFGLSNAASVAFGAAFAGLVLNNVLFLRTVWDYGVLKAGWFSVISPVVVAIVSGPAGRAAARYGFRRVLVTGTLLFSATQLWYLLVLGESAQPWTLWVPAGVLLGCSIGMTLPVLSAAAVATLPPTRYALGGAVNNTARQIGAALGVAILVAVQGHPSTPAQELAGFHRGWIFTMIAALLSAGICMLQPALVKAGATGAGGAAGAAPAPLVAVVD